MKHRFRAFLPMLPFSLIVGSVFAFALWSVYVPLIGGGVNMVKAVATTYTIGQSGHYQTLEAAAVAIGGQGSDDITLNILDDYVSSSEPSAASFSGNSSSGSLTISCNSPSTVVGTSTGQFTLALDRQTTTTVEGCTFHNTKFDDVVSQAAGAYIIQNNSFSTSTGQSAVAFNGAFHTEITISGNTGLNGISLNGDANVMIQNNLLQMTGTSTNVGVDIGSTGSTTTIETVTISNNTFENYISASNNYTRHLLVARADNTTITGNTFHNVQAPDAEKRMIQVSVTSTPSNPSLTFSQNLVRNMTNATSSDRVVHIIPETTGVTLDTTITENSFVSDGGSMVEMSAWGNGPFDINVTSTYNMFYGVGAGTGVNIDSVTTAEQTVDYNGYWNVGYNGDLSSGANDISTDPLFTNTSTYNAIAAYSSYFDVDGTQDIGYFDQSRVGTIPIGSGNLFTTSNAASTTWRSGDTLQFGAGTFDALTVSTADLTISGQGASTVINAGSAENGIYINEVNGVTVQDMVVQNASSTDATYEITNVIYSYNGIDYNDGDLLGSDVGAPWYASSTLIVNDAATCNSSEYHADGYDVTSIVGDATESWNLALSQVNAGGGVRYITLLVSDSIYSTQADYESSCAGQGVVATDKWVDNIFTVSGGVYEYASSTVAADSNLTMMPGFTDPASLSLSNTYYAGIKINGASNVTIQNVTSTNNGYNIWFSGSSSGNTVSSSVFSGASLYDVYSDTSADNSLKNVSFNTASSSVSGAGNVDVYFKSRAYVSGGGSALGGVDVTFTRKDNLASETLTTAADGWTPYTDFLLGYTMTSSSATSVIEGGYNPWAIEAAATSTYDAASTNENLDTQNEEITLAMTVGNTAPTVTAISPDVATDGGGLVTVTTTVTDSDNDTVTLSVDYSTDGGGSWASSTLDSVSGTGSPTSSVGQISSITGTSGGNALTFTWDSQADSVTSTSQVKLRIRAYDGTDYSSWTSSSNFIVDNVAPTAPSSFTFTPTTSSLQFAWDTVSDASTYTVSTTAGSATTTASTSTTYSSLTPNTEYTFQVKATDSYGNVSAYATATSTYTDPAIPGKPSVFPVSDMQLVVMWAANSNPGTTLYELYNVTTGAIVTTTTATSYNVTGLTPNTQYTFKVLAKSAANSSNDSSYSANSTAVYTHVAAPATPSIGSASTSQLTLTFGSDSNSSSTEYAIYETGTGNYVAADLGLDAATPVWQTTSTWSNPIITGLTPNTSYTFALIARSADNVETVTTTASAAYTAVAQAGQPTLSSASTSSMDIAFSANGNPGTTQYRIYNVTDSSTFTTTTATSTTITSLTPNKSYQFSVIALNGGSGSDAATSTASTATYTNPVVPVTPSAAENGQTSLIVSWNSDTNASGTTYQLYNDTSGSVVGTTTSTSYTVTGLAAGTSYQFAVRARYSSDNSTYTSYSSTSTAVSTAAVQSTVSVTLSVGASSTFQLEDGGESHTVTIDAISGNSVTTTIESTPQTVSLDEGESENIDTDGDGTDDMTVTADSVDGDAGTAELSLASYTPEPSDNNNNDSGSSGGGGAAPAPSAPSAPTDGSAEFVINNDETTTDTQTVTLSLNSPDAVQMAVSNDATFAGVSYETYTDTKQWTLTPGNGEKTVYVKLRSAAGGQKTISDTITLTDQATDQVEPIVVENCPLTVGNAYKAPNTSAVYYISEAHNADGTINERVACSKRPFLSSQVYFTYFDEWSDTQVIDQATLSVIPTDTLGFMPQGPKYDPQYGALVKVVTDPKVYLLLGGNKQWITSETVFEALNYSWHWIEDVSQSLLTKYTSKGEINDTDHHPNFTLIKYENDPKVYRLEPDPQDDNEQVKRWIPNEAAFEALNFRWDRIVTIDADETYETGAQLQ